MKEPKKYLSAAEDSVVQKWAELHRTNLKPEGALDCRKPTTSPNFLEGTWKFDFDKPAASKASSCACLTRADRHHWVFRNTASYQMEYCSSCETIKTFHWKSFWRRLRTLFINETL